MNKDVPVAELNLPSAGSGKFSWDPNSRSNSSEDETDIIMTDRWAVMPRWADPIPTVRCKVRVLMRRSVLI